MKRRFLPLPVLLCLCACDLVETAYEPGPAPYPATIGAKQDSPLTALHSTVIVRLVKIDGHYVRTGLDAFDLPQQGASVPLSPGPHTLYFELHPAPATAVPVEITLQAAPNGRYGYGATSQNHYYRVWVYDLQGRIMAYKDLTWQK